VLEPAQATALLRVLDDRAGVLALTAFGTGLRWGELGGLRRGRVDRLRRHLQVVEALHEDGKGRLWFGDVKSRRRRSARRAPAQGRRARRVVFTAPRGGPL
jgi:integrase